MSKTELQERRDFIEESLKLKENKILNSSEEQIIVQEARAVL